MWDGAGSGEPMQRDLTNSYTKFKSIFLVFNSMLCLPPFCFLAFPLFCSTNWLFGYLLCRYSVFKVLSWLIPLYTFPLVKNGLLTCICHFFYFCSLWASGIYSLLFYSHLSGFSYGIDINLLFCLPCLNSSPLHLFTFTRFFPLTLRHHTKEDLGGKIYFWIKKNQHQNDKKEKQWWTRALSDTSTV